MLTSDGRSPYGMRNEWHRSMLVCGLSLLLNAEGEVSTTLRRGTECEAPRNVVESYGLK
jgi:hypothetical protein